MRRLQEPRVPHMVFTRVSDEGRAAVEAAAEREGVSKSDILRRAIRTAERIRKRLADEETTAAERELLLELLKEEDE